MIYCSSAPRARNMFILPPCARICNPFRVRVRKDGLLFACGVWHNSLALSHSVFMLKYKLFKYLCRCQGGGGCGCCLCCCSSGFGHPASVSCLMYKAPKLRTRALCMGGGGVDMIWCTLCVCSFWYIYLWFLVFIYINILYQIPSTTHTFYT